MRFFAHDGVATHGPAAIEELLKLPGFDGDTLVCPVGSDDSADWKPALAYPPFKKALLEAATASVISPLEPMGAPKAASPMLAMLSGGLPPLKTSAPLISPMSPLPLSAPAAPAPAPSPKTVPCPRCAHANLAEARFCNACGSSMTETPPPPAPEPPKAVEAPKPEAVEPPKPAPVAPPKPAPPPETEKPPLPPEPPKPEPLKAEPEPAFPAPLDAPSAFPAPAPDPFARLDPLNFPPSPEPPAEPSPATPPATPAGPGHRPLQPGKMGQLAAFEPEPATTFASVAALPAEPAAPAPKPAWKKPPVLAAVAAVLLAAAGLAYKALVKPAPAPAVAELTPAPEPPPPAPVAQPEPPQPLYSTPAPTSSPSIPDPRAAKPRRAAAKAPAPKPARVAAEKAEAPVAAAKPRRARKARPARPPKPAPAEETPKAASGEKDPLLEALLSDATQGAPEAAGEQAAAPAPKAAPKPAKSAAKAPAAAPGRFALPGLQRPVSASDRAAAAAPPAEAPSNEETLAKLVDGSDAGPLAEPGAPAASAAPGAPPRPGIENEPAKAAEGDQLALVQVHEQFDFCAQLLSQGAYGDHYDTCLCKDARDAAPYRGRRGVYVTARKKEASAGTLETTASILTSKIEGGVATVRAKWKSSPKDIGRDSSQTWRLEDGLWCQAP